MAIKLLKKLNGIRITPVHELTFELPVEARVFLDKAYNAKADELSILEERVEYSGRNRCGVNANSEDEYGCSEHDW